MKSSSIWLQSITPWGRHCKRPPIRHSERTVYPSSVSRHGLHQKRMPWSSWQQPKPTNHGACSFVLVQNMHVIPPLCEKLWHARHSNVNMKQDYLTGFFSLYIKQKSVSIQSSLSPKMSKQRIKRHVPLEVCPPLLPLPWLLTSQTLLLTPLLGWGVGGSLEPANYRVLTSAWLSSKSRRTFLQLGGLLPSICVCTCSQGLLPFFLNPLWPYPI